nr:MAG: MCE-family protein [Mycolicibacterium hassiacum]
MLRLLVRPLVGLAAIALAVLVTGVSVQLFRGGFADSIEVTVISSRAGLVMNPDAKVQVRGVQVGRVASIEPLPDGRAALHLDVDSRRLDAIPANAFVDIASPTVFGAKQVRLAFPPNPPRGPLRRGRGAEPDPFSKNNCTVFEQLSAVLAAIEPAKLNQTLGAISSALAGRGDKLGQTLADLHSYLATLEPTLPALREELHVAPEVLRAYADTAADFVSITDSAARISDSVVDERHNLDAALISVIGLADVGQQVVGENRDDLAEVAHLLVPTTSLLDEYNQALWCALSGMVEASHIPPFKKPGVMVLAGFLWGQERYRYPNDLPKAGAKGGPQCAGLPKMPYGSAPPYVVADTGTNPWRRRYPGIVLNSDLIKQIMFGDTEHDGPPRNTAQIGQPG